MAATAGTGRVGSAGEREDRRTWGGYATGFAQQMSGANFRRGDLAQLRRMNPDTPDAPAYWRLLASRKLLGDPEWERKWALILHGIALMTRAPVGAQVGRVAHDNQTPVGRALFQGGESGRRESGYFSESRLSRLLTARGPALHALLGRMFRMMAAANQPFNWFEMARLILCEGHDKEGAEQARHRIAREYYRAEQRSLHSDGEQRRSTGA